MKGEDILDFQKGEKKKKGGGGGGGGGGEGMTPYTNYA